jgi:hypothetical protein
MRSPFRSLGISGLAASLALSLVGSVFWGASWSSTASAAVYDVHFCDQAPPPISLTNDRPRHLEVESRCGTTGVIFQVATLDDVRPIPHENLVVNGSRAWTLTAPIGTKIVGLDASRAFNGSWFADSVRWELRTTPVLGGPGVVLEQRQSNPDPNGDFTNPPTVRQSYDIAAATGGGVNAVTSVFGCLHPAGGSNPCGSFREYSVALGDLVAHLDDPFAPEPPMLSGSLLALAPLSGTRELAFRTVDSGSGVAAVTLSIDGAVAQTAANLNGGHCSQPYTTPMPCDRFFNSNFSVDTRTLGDGEHTALVTVRDAAGQTTSSGAMPITVSNPPPSTEAPLPTVTAAPDTAAPVLSHASLLPRRFRAGVSGSSLVARRVTRGTVLRFTSSEAGNLSIAISRARGAKPGGARPFATIVRSISAGPGRVRLSGSIGKGRLRPGSYRLALTARDAAGNVSRVVRLSFTVLPG